MARPCRGLLVVIAFDIAVACAVPATAQPPAALLIGDWCRAVATHTPGQPDDALARAATWSHADLTRLQPIVAAVGGVGPEAIPTNRRDVDQDARARLACAASWASTDVQGFRVRAILLHTDVISIAGPVAEAVPAPMAPHLKTPWQREEVERRVLLRADDGRSGGYQLASLHLELAMGLLATIRAEQPAHSIVPLWYRTVGAHLASESRFGEATPHFERARRAVPDDAGVLYGEACFQETLSSPRVQDVVRTTQLPNGLRILDVAAPDVHLRRAARLLHRSLARQPTLVDARIRLARILTLQGSADTAREVLAALDPSATLVPRQQFFLHMIAGDAALAAGAAPEAVLAFARAARVFPRAQSARMALAHAQRVSGDRAAARDALLPLLEVDAAAPG